MVRVIPRPLYSRGKSPRYSLERRLGGPQNWSGPCEEEKNILPLPVIEPRPARNLVGISTEMSRTEVNSGKPHDSCSTGQDLNSGPLEYEAGITRFGCFDAEL
jgi:hypothetical protein